MKEKSMQIIPELTDEDGFVVTVEALERGHAARDVCRARDALGESEEEFGARFNVSPKTVFDWEFNRVAAPAPVVSFARSIVSNRKQESTTAEQASTFATAVS